MIRCSVFLVNLISRTIDGIKRIHTDTTLKACRCFLSEQTLHLNFLHQIFCALMDVGETVHLLPCNI